MVRQKNNEQWVREYQAETDPVEKKKIADQFYKKIYRLVIKYAGRMPDICYGTQDDLIQEASLIFMKCLDKFNPNKKIKFSTYFGRACEYELAHYKKKQRKHVDNAYFLEIDEIIQAKPQYVDDKIDDRDAIQKIQKVLLKLNKEQKITEKQFNTIIDEHGFFGHKRKTRKQIAEERGCTLQNVGFLYRKAINHIKDELGDITEY